MSEFVIETVRPPKPGGYPYRLLKDGDEVFGGRFGDCLRHALIFGFDTDTLTSGTKPPYIDRPIVEERTEYNKRRIR
jgi:hypothetical protein